MDEIVHWNNLFYAYQTSDIEMFNRLFSHYIDEIFPHGEQFQASVKILEGFFYSGHRARLFESMCALRRLEPQSVKYNAMLLATSIAQSKWDVVTGLVRLHARDPEIRKSLTSILALWWPTIAAQSPDSFKQLLCEGILRHGPEEGFGDALYIFAQALSGSAIDPAALAPLDRCKEGTHAVAMLAYVRQERFEWLEALELWTEVYSLAPDFPDVDQAIARCVCNISAAKQPIIEILRETATAPHVQAAVKRSQFHNFVFVEKRKAIYRINPKVASTEMLSRIARLNTSEDKIDIDAIHDDTTILQRLDGRPAEQIEEILTSRDWVRFSFVRDPVRRFVSGYLNKCVKLHLAIDGYKPFLRALGLLENVPTFIPMEIRDDFSVDTLINFVEQSRPENIDGHFAPQTLVLNTVDFQYSFIGKLESFAADLQAVSDLIGLDLIGPQASRHETESLHYAQDILSQHNRRRIETYYEADRRVFGYT